MVKFVVYTSNLPFMPKNMGEVINFAKENSKFRIASVELNPCLANIKAGDNIISKKGNSIYVIKAINESLDDLNPETREYLDTLTREYGLKKVGITGVENIIHFETWCKSAKPIINSKNNKEMTTKNSIKNFAERLESMFMPVKAENVRIAVDGNICVATNQGYVAISTDNTLTSYVEEMTLDLPVFIMSKPQEQLTVGDVIALDRSYAKITKIDGDKISAIGYTGSGKTIHTIKDFLFNQTMVRVVVSLAGNIGGQINPMIMMAMAKKSDKDSLLPLLMMSQNGGMVGMNPAMLMMMSGKEDFDFKDMMMMSMFNGNQNPFANMFGMGQAPIQENSSDLANPVELKEAKEDQNPND